MMITISETKLHRLHFFTNSFSIQFSERRGETKQMLSFIRENIEIQNSFVSAGTKMYFDKCLMNWGIFICRMFIFESEILLRSSMNPRVESMLRRNEKQINRIQVALAAAGEILK